MADSSTQASVTAKEIRRLRMVHKKVFDKGLKLRIKGRRGMTDRHSQTIRLFLPQGEQNGMAIAILGRNANGWKEWKDKIGGTLDELKRQAEEADDKTST